MNKIIFFNLLIVFIQGCSPNAEKSYNSGYRDGYADGYNTVCEFNAGITKGDWNNENYARGYSDGQADGAANGINAARADNCKPKGYLIK